MLQRYFGRLATVLIVCYSMFVLTGCDGKSNNVDTSGVSIRYNSIRYDREVYNLDTTNLSRSLDSLGAKYPDFSAVYFNELTGFAMNQDRVLFEKSLHHFLTYKDYRNLYDTVQILFPDTKSIDKELETLCKHIKYYFPSQKWGTVYYFISGLNFWSAVTVDTLIGVGLDMYLGKDYPYYASVQLPQYQIDRCEKTYIAVNVARAIQEDMFPYNPEGKTLLDLMILKGKQLVFMKKVLPSVGDELLMGYTKEQLAWCKDNEGMIWSYFAKRNLLYSTEWQEMIRYVSDGPTSTGMPPESPGNIGSWIGWQIVKKYLAKNPSISWQEMMSKKVESKILIQEATYNPR